MTRRGWVTEHREKNLRSGEVEGEHLAFGRGAHTCIGNPLARAEVHVLFDRFFEHTADLKISEREHGPAGDRWFDYEPSYIVRGLTKLHVELVPATADAEPGQGANLSRKKARPVRMTGRSLPGAQWI